MKQPFDDCRKGSLAVYLTTDRYKAMFWYIAPRWGLEADWSFEMPNTHLLPDTNDGQPMSHRMNYYSDGGMAWPARYALWLD